MPKASIRPSLPTSSSDFALPPSSSSPGASGSSITLDDPSFLLQRFRRPSLLQKAGYLSDSRHSPLASSFTLHARRRSQTAIITEEFENERERMLTDSPSSSENHTPPLKASDNSEEGILVVKPRVSKPPLTPPRRRSSASMDSDMPTIFNRRLSFPLKQPRILKILSEPKPEEDEVKSEAAFQRLIHSSSELPMQPRTPRPFPDRGRYPEEAVDEEVQREDTPSDDEGQVEDTPFAFNEPNATQPISIHKIRTPVGSAAGSINGDDLSMSVSETSSSFGTTAMDIDMVGNEIGIQVNPTQSAKQPLGSPLLTSMPTATPNNYWRYTPPPTSSAIRSNKRKLEDRFDPYPTSSKRRAVSPSLLYLRDNHQSSNSPGSRGNSSRFPISIPINIPTSTASSAASSPTITGAYPQYPRAMSSSTSSPTIRPTPMLLASPIIRPLPRRRLEGEEREVEGAGEAVNGLTLRG